ncbi:hypothetical protein GCM10011519_09510 [Marmoricola endophyticus]|uniref:SAV-6107-like HEPN domain-containing protein n=1 Tax=Marmoricola endophyticus TaxID=2040280 RepID=A0A917BEM9_9ACTN|nr:SAV_6107 family HEPN domain-containing protein [Marmoricola endophyticus]GGF38043.1 hypothetical protein GCM10011519_09510 [Marmoricola endophyticus]
MVTASGAALGYLQRASGSLHEARDAREAGERYAAAHVCALQATAAVLAARARPDGPPRGRRQRNAWVLLTRVAPELGEWATLFAAGASKRAAAQAGARHAVSEREADDLLRDADRYLAVVEDALGVVRHAPVEQWSVA